MKTLYISDLDGTLLNNKSEISDNTADIINRLTDRGILFSVATARNIGTAFDKVKRLNLTAPMSMMNGVFTYYQDIIKPINIYDFPKEQAILLSEASIEVGASPFVYTYNKDDHLMYLHYFDLDYPPRKHFYELRKNAVYKKFIKINAASDILMNKSQIPVYINFLDEYDVLERVYSFVKTMSGIQSVFYFDPVLKAWYLEVFSDKAGKAAGVKKIAEIVNADKIVTFGDNNNDLSMFEISDECYATANAADEIKKYADGVLQSCNNDAVALFLKERYKI